MSLAIDLETHSDLEEVFLLDSLSFQSSCQPYSVDQTRKASPPNYFKARTTFIEIGNIQNLPSLIVPCLFPLLIL